MPASPAKDSWKQRRKAKLDVCLDSFGAQFHEWKARTEQPEWSSHYSQVRAIEALLTGVSVKVGEALREAEGEEDFAENLPQFERAMLSGWRVWEFFRSKLAQRQEEQFQPGLRAADELAWACRLPLARAAEAIEGGKSRPREPALVFLNGNASPVALARGRNFWAEAAPGMGQLDALCDELLKHVPVPLISLPWHEIWHIPSLTAVAHETGHIVEEDFQLTADLDAALTAAAAEAEKAGGQIGKESWLEWRAEIFADFFAVRHCGPAFTGMLGDLLANSGQGGKAYPPADLRMELCFAGLELMELKAEADARRAAWKEITGSEATPDQAAAARAVVGQLASWKMTSLAGKTFAELIFFNQSRLDLAISIKQDLANHRVPVLSKPGVTARDAPPGGVEGLPQLLAVAARLLYEEDSGSFADESASLDIIRLIASVNAGQRRGLRRSLTKAAASSEDLQESVKKAWSGFSKLMEKTAPPLRRPRTE